jgi:hypothetical protein
MCGATGAQTQIQDEELQAYQQAQQMTAEEYADQKAIYAPMESQFQSIFAMGPDQEGFSGGEKADLNAQAVEGTATNYGEAAKAVGEKLAAEGGGNAEVSSGGADELKEQVAESAAQSESSQETQIEEADYNQGRQNWQAAGEGLETIASGENPLGYENAETSSGSAAGTTANQIAEEDNSWINAAIGAAGSIGGGFAGDFSFGGGG